MTGDRKLAFLIRFPAADLTGLVEEFALKEALWDEDTFTKRLRGKTGEEDTGKKSSISK